jgi:pimeloyl-ACP methyl ester carboxylesterase
MRLMVKAIPNARYYQLKNCGHLPQNEQPKIFLKVVNDFISEVKQ